MSDYPQQCPKCNGEMEQGFVIEFAPRGRMISIWVAGPPRKDFWYGIQLPKGKLLPIGTFRCTDCGYLESYARKEFTAQ